MPTADHGGMLLPCGSAVLALLLAAAGCASPDPSPTVGSGTATVTVEWRDRLVAAVRNPGDSPAQVEVEWSLQRPDGSWWPYYSEAATLPPGTERVFRPDCVWPGLGEVSVVGHGLTHREWYDGAAFCYSESGTAEGTTPPVAATNPDTSIDGPFVWSFCTVACDAPRR